MNSNDDQLDDILEYHHDEGDDMRASCRATWGKNTFSDCDCGLKETKQQILNLYIAKAEVMEALPKRRSQIEDIRKEREKYADDETSMYVAGVLAVGFNIAIEEIKGKLGLE